MNDIISINRQFLVMAREMASNTGIGEVVTGLPRSVLERLKDLSLEEIEALAREIGVSLITFRLKEAELNRLLFMPKEQRPAYSLMVVANKNLDS
jgi:flagellar transcriptional activator FlhD